MQLNGPPGAVSGVVFAKQGKALISVNSDATALVWDLTGRSTRGKLPPPKTGEPELVSHWNDLGSLDAAKAYRAMWNLAEADAKVIPFLRARLRPVAAADPKRLAALIKELGSEQFASRNQAARELAQLGDAAESALREADLSGPTLEVKRRIDQLLQALAPPISSPERLRAVRAIEALEYRATSEARQLLAELAKGLQGALVTREAQASLQRLAGRAVDE